MLQHIAFLRAVLLFSITAFGGPQSHIAMMLRTFVQERKDITEKELMDYNAFCQVLPGASSTQIVTLIGYKKGGYSLAILTLLIWILPASTLMTVFALLLSFLEEHQLQYSFLFTYLQPMAVGFVLYSAVRLMKLSVNIAFTRFLVCGVAIVTFIFFKSPWVYPAMFLLVGLLANIVKKRNEVIKEKTQKLHWRSLRIFLLIFALVAILSESARKNDWQLRPQLNLFENFYRFGSLVFGGGDVLVPMMYEQYVSRKERLPEDTSRLFVSKKEFFSGYGMVKAVPGPTFSFSAFLGAILLKEKGKISQINGAIIASIAIFLPSTLLVLFFFPVWNNLKKYAAIHRSIEGINAAVVGIIFATFFFLLRDLWINIANDSFALVFNLLVVLITFALLYYTKIKAPYIVAGCLLLSLVY